MTSNTAPAHPHMTGVAMYPALLGQPEILGKLISELLLFSRFFLNFPRPYIPIEWSNFWGGRMFGQQLCGGEKLGSRYGFLSLFSIGEKLRGENREHGNLRFFLFFTHG